MGAGRRGVTPPEQQAATGLAYARDGSGREHGAVRDAGHPAHLHRAGSRGGCAHPLGGGRRGCPSGSAAGTVSAKSFSASRSHGPGGDQIRILAVGNMYPPQHAGGYERAWQQAMEHARALGHDVRVLTSNYREDPHRPEDDPDVHRTLRWYWDLERYEFPRLTPAQRLALERAN